MWDEEAGSRSDTAGLEGALARVERAVEASGKAVASVARELKRARAAAASGQVRELRRALDAAQAMAGDVVQRVDAAATAYEVDTLSSGAYAKELLAAAEAADVAMFADDDRLLCYPSIVRVLPGEAALEIDRKRACGIRPSVVVAALAKAQRAGPRFKPAPFLASAVSFPVVVHRSSRPLRSSGSGVHRSRVHLDARMQGNQGQLAAVWPEIRPKTRASAKLVEVW